MDINSIIKRLNLPSEIAEKLKSKSINSLYPPQRQALEIGLFRKKNLVLAMPTAGGKTLVAEFYILNEVLKNHTHCLYIVPLKALASEKYEDFQAKYKDLGLKIGIATSDYDLPSSNLSRYEVLVATQEKIDSLLRFRARWLVDRLGLVIIDEIHYLDDPSRGPTLEILIARLRELKPSLRILALSATISNSLEIASWLGAELILSNFRPIPLKEGVYFNQKIRFSDGTIKHITRKEESDLIDLCLDTLKNQGQVLIFVNNRRSTQAEAKRLARILPKYFSLKIETLKGLAKQIEGFSQESTKICRQLSECVKKAVAFHHAGLRANQRRIIEEGFRNNLIKVIVATPTLAAGVNLPAQRVIIRNLTRYQLGKGQEPIAVFEYKQCAGRAGRPQYDKFGEAVILSSSYEEMIQSFDSYIFSQPEPITSKLASESALRMHILSSIASGYTNNFKSLQIFLSYTFFAHQRDIKELNLLLENTLEFLENAQMIKIKNEKFRATLFGECVSRLYIDPLSGFILKQNLIKSSFKKIKDVLLLDILCRCPDMERLSLKSKDPEELERFYNLNHKYLSREEDYIEHLKRLKTVWFLKTWIEEKKEEELCEQFGIGPGDIYRYTELAEWLSYAGVRICSLFGLKRLSQLLSKLTTRIHYGAKEELLELLTLKNIGRIRARSLYKGGFRYLTALKKATLKELEKIPHIGKEIALQIKSQIKDLY